MRRIAMAAAAGTVALLAGSANAQSITTLFASNNGGNAGGGVYFTIQVGPMPLQITGYDVNTSATSAFGFEAYITAPGGTHVGNEANPGAWTLVTTGSGAGAGTDNPSPVTINSSFILQANTTYGMALANAAVGGLPAANHRYTNGTGANQFFQNADLSLTLGSATNVLFSGSPFMPRVWNGTIYYNVIPAPASLALLGLGGLVATRRRR